jgi:kynurenine formamidase
MEEYALVGHSAGACLAFQVLDKVPGCKAIIGIEGIYDLESLVAEYPSYGDFVQEAFGTDRRVWREASPTTLIQQQNLSNIAIQLIHSTEDELLTPRQTSDIFSILQRQTCVLPEIAWTKGTHNDTLRTRLLHTLIYTFLTSLN